MPVSTATPTACTHPCSSLRCTCLSLLPLLLPARIPAPPSGAHACCYCHWYCLPAALPLPQVLMPVCLLPACIPALPSGYHTCCYCHCYCLPAAVLLPRACFLPVATATATACPQLCSSLRFSGLVTDCSPSALADLLLRGNLQDLAGIGNDAVFNR